jgi:hypothetical protein
MSCQVPAPSGWRLTETQHCQMSKPCAGLNPSLLAQPWQATGDCGAQSLLGGHWSLKKTYWKIPNNFFLKMVPGATLDVCVCS